MILNVLYGKIKKGIFEKSILKIMNRLVIIGNGFDKAHRLPTSYGDFIDDYWKSIESASHDDKFVSFQNIDPQLQFKEISSLDGLANFIIERDEKVKYSDAEIFREFGNNILTGEYPRDHLLLYKNDFFKAVNSKKLIKNWVDIENEYYQLLKKIALPISSSETDKKDKLKKLKKLNDEFEDLKILFEEYLAKKVNVKSAFENDNSNVDKILSFFKIQFKYLDTSLSVENTESIAYSKEFNNEDLEELISFDFKIIEASKRDNLYQDLKSGIIEQNNLFLNFNYTNTINNYVKLLNNGDYCGRVEEVQIHGKLFDYKNEINFGFGDEMDDDYKLIENINNNEYLKNFKSFGYNQNSNYRKLLDFIDYKKFQVFIMGHSCGLSDRTLLNTIFEHVNCRSIKVFYHEEKNEEGDAIRDNFTELMQNISRHFNDKVLMRSKIVNKTSCQPLPQKQLLKKQ